MKFVVTSGQMKNAEITAAEKGIHPTTLMENAGNECYKKIAELVGGVADKTFVVLCGRGNNGGDGIVTAARIRENGGTALCIFTTDLPSSECARESYSRYCGANGVDTALYTHREDVVKKALTSCDVIIDCVFGTGFEGALETRLTELFRFVGENCRALKFSVDVPSGVNATTGEIADGAFRPDVTLVLAAVKSGLFSHPCFDFCGNLVLLNIGIPQDCYTEFTACITEDDILRYQPVRFKSAHKGSFGRLLNISGSERYMGSALLSTKAALRSGVGLIAVASPKSVCRAIAPAVPEAVYINLYSDENGYPDEDSIDEISKEIGRFTAVIIGPGIGVTAETVNLTQYVIKNSRCPVILDADGINSIKGNINSLKDNDKPLILTPHPAEFSRLCGIPIEEIQAARIRHASAFAREYGVVLVLKGANTVVAAPDGRVSVNPTGNAGLAKAGAGDVLTGVIGSLAAQGVGAYEAAVLGVYLHGKAADALAEKASLAGLLPSDVADYLPFVMD